MNIIQNFLACARITDNPAGDLIADMRRDKRLPPSFGSIGEMHELPYQPQRLPGDIGGRRRCLAPLSRLGAPTGERRTAMKVREIQQQLALKQMLRDKRPSRGRILTTIKPLGEMLLDRRFGEVSAQLLEICFASVLGQADRQDCFVCLEPWTMDRVLETVGVAEFDERPDADAVHSLAFGICRDCSWDRPAVIAALKRDFGDFAEFVDTPGTA